MSGALVVYDQKFPAGRGGEKAVTFLSGHCHVDVPAAPCHMGSEVDRSGWIVIEEAPGTYGLDARIKSGSQPGLIIDTYV